MSEVDPAVLQEAQQATQAAAPPPAPPAPPPAPPAAVAPAPPPPVVTGAAEASAGISPAGQEGAIVAPPVAPPVPQGPLPTPAPAAAPVAAPKVLPADWPHAGYDGPQPWEADNPPALTQNHLMVSGGSAGAEVVELAAYLGALGYETFIGNNPHAIYDQRLASVVAQFCNEYGVKEDPAVLRARTEDTVGPWIWEALVRAVHKRIAESQPAS